MSIKVTLGEVKTQEEKPFPKLMANGYGCIRLVYECGSSVILKSAENAENAEVSWFESRINAPSDWDISDFTDYNEPITLQNL